MTVPTSEAAPVFVSAEEGARRCMVGIETFRGWSRSGLIPAPHIDRGQIVRWHWPSVETALAARDAQGEHDPFVEGVSHVDFTPKRRRARAPAP
jgi:hypothetical protein